MDSGAFKPWRPWETEKTTPQYRVVFSTLKSVSTSLYCGDVDNGAFKPWRPWQTENTTLCSEKIQDDTDDDIQEDDNIE